MPNPFIDSTDVTYHDDPELQAWIDKTFGPNKASNELDRPANTGPADVLNCDLCSLNCKYRVA